MKSKLFESKPSGSSIKRRTALIAEPAIRSSTSARATWRIVEPVCNLRPTVLPIFESRGTLCPHAGLMAYKFISGDTEKRPHARYTRHELDAAYIHTRAPIPVSSQRGIEM